MVCIFGDFPAIQRSRLYFGEERENHFFRLISTFSIDSQPVLLAYLILLCDSIYCLTYLSNNNQFHQSQHLPENIKKYLTKTDSVLKLN